MSPKDQDLRHQAAGPNAGAPARAVHQPGCGSSAGSPGADLLAAPGPLPLRSRPKGAQTAGEEHQRGGQQHDNPGLGINGFGRIGRTFTRLALERTDLEVVAINDITDARTMAHLLAFDSTFGRLGRPVEHTPDSLTRGRHPHCRAVRAGPGPPCRAATGRASEPTWLSSPPGSSAPARAPSYHLKGGARKVLISAPGKGVDLTVVLRDELRVTKKTRRGTTLSPTRPAPPTAWHRWPRCCMTRLAPSAAS